MWREAMAHNKDRILSKFVIDRGWIGKEEQVGIQMASAVQEELRTGVAHE